MEQSERDDLDLEMVEHMTGAELDVVIKRTRYTRGIPIERLADPDQYHGEAVFVITDKVNEIIDRINKMNEVQGG